jgi:type IV secretory pathway TrbF-like protein
MTSADSKSNPYLDGRREWNERYGSYIAQKRVWQVTAIVSIAVNGVLTGGLVYQSSQSRVQPFIVEVDKLGQAVAVAPAEQITTYDERVVRAQLGNLVSFSRSVTPDHVVQKKWLAKVYAMLSPQAMEQMNEYYRAHDPFQASKTQKVTVEVISALPISKDTWQLQWDETRRSLDGHLDGRTRWQAIFEITFVRPTSPKAIMENPTGMIIKSFSWTQQL